MLVKIVLTLSPETAHSTTPRVIIRACGPDQVSASAFIQLARSARTTRSTFYFCFLRFIIFVPSEPSFCAYSSFKENLVVVRMVGNKITALFRRYGEKIFNNRR